MLTMLASDELVFNARNFKILNSWPNEARQTSPRNFVWTSRARMNGPVRRTVASHLRSTPIAVCNLQYS